MALNDTDKYKLISIICIFLVAYKKFNYNHHVARLKDKYDYVICPDWFMVDNVAPALSVSTLHYKLKKIKCPIFVRWHIIVVYKYIPCTIGLLVKLLETKLPEAYL